MHIGTPFGLCSLDEAVPCRIRSNRIVRQIHTAAGCPAAAQHVPALFWQAALHWWRSGYWVSPLQDTI